jgi:hypothetical protein
MRLNHEWLNNLQKKKKNSVASVREWTIPTEGLPLVDEVPTFADKGCRMLSFLDWSHYIFLSSISSIVLTRLDGPDSRSTTSENLLGLESKPNLRICSQEPWPLDHRGGWLNNIKKYLRKITVMMWTGFHSLRIWSNDGMMKGLQTR